MSPNFVTVKAFCLDRSPSLYTKNQNVIKKRAQKEKIIGPRKFP